MNSMLYLVLNLLAASALVLVVVLDYRKHRSKPIPIATDYRKHDLKEASVDVMTLPGFNFVDLPDEILISVVRGLDILGLNNIRGTCRHLKEISDPFIYEKFEVLHGRDALRLAACIHADQRRIRWIKSLLVSIKYGDDDGLGILPKYLAGMRSMRHLRLETPDCNTKKPEDRAGWVNLQKAYEAVLAQSTVAIPENKRLLPNLETCTIHFVDDTKALYPLTKYSSIFLHPTLKFLTLSCACSDFPARLLAPYQKQYKHSTALEHLHLEECDILSSSLHVLLSFPRALKSLVLSEGTRYDEGFGPHRSRMHGNVLPNSISAAITQSCGQTLQRLSLDLGYRRGDRNINSEGRYLDLTLLENVKKLEVSGETTQNMIIPRPHCDHGTFKRLPPNLEVLRIFGMNPYQFPPNRRIANIPFQTCLIKDKASHGVPKLQHVIWSYEHQGFESRSHFEGPVRRVIFDETQRSKQIALTKDYLIDLCNKAYPIYRDSEVRMTVEFVETPPHYIPPYLYTEPTPTSQYIWDSEDPPLEALREIQRAQEKVGSEGQNSGRRDEVEERGIAADAAAANVESESDSDFEDFITLTPQAQAFMAMLMQNVHDTA